MSRPLSRRDVLKTGLAAVAAGPVVSAARAFGLSPTAPGDGFSFAYFSDTHVALARNIEENRAMLAEIRAWSPAFAINGGDVTDYGWPGEYDNYKTLVRDLGFPTYENPGNHDVRWSPLGMKVFRKNLGQNFRHVEHEGVSLFVLDSTVPLSHWGHYEKSQLDWLAGELAKGGRTVPVVLASHHWVGRDSVVIDNELELLKVIEPYNVKLILTGHGHSDLLWEWGGFTLTQNKGLYQGSWQRVDVDRRAGEVRLSRRSATQALTELIRVPLAPRPDQRPVWAFGATAIARGESLLITGGADQVRWPNGTWNAIRPAGIPTEGRLRGQHTLAVRRGESGPVRAFSVHIKGPGPLRERWAQPLSGGVMSHLRRHGEDLIISAMDGSVRVMDAATGETRWVSMTQDYCHSSPCVAGDVVVVGSADGNVYGFDLANGATRWRTATEGPVYAGAAIAGDVVGIASGDGSMYGLDRLTGQVRWRTAMPVSNTAFAQSAAATDGTRFFVGAWDSHIYAFTAADGRQVWREPCQPRTFAFSPAIGSPVADAGNVYVVANGNGLFRFDAATGTREWEVAADGDKYGHSGPAVRRGRVFTGGLGDNGHVWCARTVDGAEVWRCATGKVIYDSSPCLGDDWLAIGSVDATLNLIDLVSGALLDQVRLPEGHFLSKPVADRQRVYAATYANIVMAYDVVR